MAFLDHEKQLPPQDFGDEEWLRIHDFRQHLLLTYLHGGTKAVSGHVMYHPRIHDAYAKTHTFVTVLRNPMDRFLSQYLYHVRSPLRYHSDVSWDQIGLSGVGRAWGLMMTYYLGGTPSHPGESLTVAQMIENAKIALNRLDVIGFVEDLTSFQDELGQKIGSRIKIRRRNQSSLSEKEIVSVAALRSTIEEFCAPDIEIYNYARALRKTERCVKGGADSL